MSIWTKAFWKDVSERAFFTAVEATIALLSVDEFTPAEFDFAHGASVVGVATVLAVLKGILANRAINNTISPASAAQ